MDLHKSNADEAESTPDEEDFALEICTLLVDHVRGSVSDGPVEEPVASGYGFVSTFFRKRKEIRTGHTEALGACLEWENLAGDDPCNGTPRAGEEEDVDTHERDGSALSRKVSGSGHGAGDGHDV